MPQKLNKAGKMQDYIPKGNGDASGEYGTSNGTNKNFTTSDKKSSKANVITENKSVVVENKGKKLTPREKIKKAVETEDIDESNKLMDEATSELKFNSEEERNKFLDIVASYSDPQEMFDYLDKVEKKDNKANVIDGDLSGVKKNDNGKATAKLFNTKDLGSKGKAMAKKVEVGKWYKFDVLGSNELMGYGKVVAINDDGTCEVEKYFELPSYRPYASHHWFDDLPMAI